MKSGPADVNPRVVRPLALHLTAIGLDVAPLLRRQGLDQADLFDPRVRITHEALLAIWDDATALSRDPDVGLRVAELVANFLPQITRQYTEFLSAALYTTSATVGAGLTRVARFHGLTAPNVAYRIRPSGKGAFRVSVHVGGAPPRAVIDFFLGWVACSVRSLTGTPAQFEEVNFGYPEPTQTTAHRRLLGSRISFSESETSFLLTAEQWSLPVKTHDAALIGELEDQATRMLELSRGDVVSRVRLLIGVAIARPPTAVQAARLMGMTRRTFARRLADSGTSYREILNDVRAEHAQRLLEAGHTRREVAPILGFSDDRALRRALSRWRRPRG